MFGKKNKRQSSGGSTNPGTGSASSPESARQEPGGLSGAPSFKDALDQPDDDLPEWSPPQDQEDGKISKEDPSADAQSSHSTTPSPAQPQPAVAQPVVANTAPNNPIAGITAPSRGSAQASQRAMPRGDVPSSAAPAAAAPAPEPRRAAPRALSENGDGKQLIVGRDIRLAGEITACQKLVVEGTVEANLTDSETLEIAESGLFTGKARVNRADIYGVFDGELEVTGHLVLHSKGQLKGKVRYKDIEVERGGRLQCDIDELGDDAGESASGAPDTPGAAAVTAGGGDRSA